MSVIDIVEKSGRILICCAVLTAQFGCASMPQPTRPAIIAENEPSTIEMVKPDTLSYRSFHWKIAELKGKIQQRHAGDTTFAALKAGVERLDQAQDSIEAGTIRVRRGLAKAGAIIPAVAIAIPLVGITLQATGGAEDWSGMGTMFLLAILPVASGLGAMAGWFGGALIAGANVKQAHKRALSALIMDYNKLDGMTSVPQSPDMTK